MTCKTCRFWLRYQCQSFHDEHDSGECHRHAPVTDVVRKLERVWPVTKSNAWCGDYEAQP